MLCNRHKVSMHMLTYSLAYKSMHAASLGVYPGLPQLAMLTKGSKARGKQTQQQLVWKVSDLMPFRLNL